MRYITYILSVGLCVLAVAVMATSAQAVPITTMDGVVGGFTMNAVGGSGQVDLTINNSFTGLTQLNGLPVPGGFSGVIPTTFAPATIQISANGQPTIDFDIQKTIGPGGNGIDNYPNPDPVTGVAVYDANLNVVTVTPVAMIIQGNETLSSNTSSLDLSLFAAGSLVMTFNSPNPGDIVALFQHAISGTGTQSLSGSASFSQSNVPFGVPEPHTIAIWLSVGLALVICARKRGFILRRN